MDPLSSRALAAALEVARTHGLPSTEPTVLRDRANLMVHLRATPVVARIATTTSLVRPAAWEFLARDLAIATFLVSRGAPVVPSRREILTALAHYGPPPSFALQPYLKARDLQGVLWYAMAASRFHQDGGKAKQWLQSWKERSSIRVPKAQGPGHATG
jgi:hypothetical protein